MRDCIYYRTLHPLPKVAVFLKYPTHIYFQTLPWDSHTQQQREIFVKNQACFWEQRFPSRITQWLFNKTARNLNLSTPQPTTSHYDYHQHNTHTGTNSPPVSNALLRQLSWIVVTLASLILFDGLAVLAFCLHATDSHSRVESFIQSRSAFCLYSVFTQWCL